MDDDGLLDSLDTTPRSVGAYDHGGAMLWVRETDIRLSGGSESEGLPGLEIWCRSRYDVHQRPWVFDAEGEVIASYELSKVAPADWTPKGVEEIWVIDRSGEPKQLAAAKERHEEGDVCIFDPMTGRFVERFPARAARLFVADVSGDRREELVAVDGPEVRVHWNPRENPRPDRPRLWERNAYRRSRMNWNSYSP